MTKEPQAYERRGKQGAMLWTSVAEKHVAVIGEHMEAVGRRMENEIYPVVSVKNRDGSWNVNLIVEEAVRKLARDLSIIDPVTWKQHEQAYLDSRAEGFDKKLYLSEVLQATLPKIIDYLQRADVINLMAAGKVNLKLIYAIALSYTAASVG